MSMKPEISVLFVCLGNICRSPLAEGVLARHLEVTGLSERVRVDSAGTGDWHVGQGPDPRSIAVAAEHGVDLKGHARQVRPGDFSEFTYILAMDRSNLQDLRNLRYGSGSDASVQLFTNFDPDPNGHPDVPDPYYGEGDGFVPVFEMVDRTCHALAHHFLSELTS